MTPYASFEDLTFTYRGQGTPALRAINGKVPAGGLVAVMGHSGAGKSSLCCTLNGLIPGFFGGEYHGRVFVRGQEVARRRVAEMSRFVGLVLQDYEAQLFSTNVELEMAFGPENQRVPREEIAKRVHRYLAAVGLQGMGRREPASLSGGQKQRLAIGSVLAMEPQLLVMDEPTTDLDPHGGAEVLSLAKAIRDSGRTLVLVDHAPASVLDADVLWLMRNGAIVAQGPPAEILQDIELLTSCGVSAPPTVALFSAMNWPGRPLTLEGAMDAIQAGGLASRRETPPRRGSPAQPQGDIVLRAEGLEYAYPGWPARVLRGIDLSIGEGEFVAILGQNASGKSTLAKQFNGLLKPTTGTMLAFGKPTTAYAHREMAERVGYVFQNPDHQIFARSVGEEVGFSLRVLGKAPGAVAQRVAEALEVVGLRGREAALPFTLTKGERQRVAVASVLAARPQVLVLDEPTTGLDYPQQRNMMEMVRRLNLAGHTVILITHAMWVAEQYARRTVVLKDGRVLLDGPTREVFRDEATLAQASLEPTPSVRLSNWLGTHAMSVEGLIQELKG